MKQKAMPREAIRRSEGFALIFLLIMILGFGIIAVSFWAGTKSLFTTPPTPSASPIATPNEGTGCVEKSSLDCANEPELSYECTTEYQDWAMANCPGWEGGSEGQFCGGLAGLECPSRYACQLEGNYPDAGGVCTKLTEQILPVSNSELDMGWYFGTKDQKKPNTPAGWTYTEAGRSSCWHKPGTQCEFLPD